VSLDNVIIQAVVPAAKDYVGIAGQVNGRTVFYAMGSLDEKTLHKFGKIVHDNRGELLLSIGTVELPPDED
jgi:hypothetical protein